MAVSLLREIKTETITNRANCAALIKNFKTLKLTWLRKILLFSLLKNCLMIMFEH